MLSFVRKENSNPIACIKSGNKKPKIIYINDDIDNQHTENHNKFFDYISENKIKTMNKGTKLSSSKMKKLAKSVANDIEPDNEELLCLYRNLTKDYSETIKKEIITDYGDTIEILPSKSSERIYMCGPSGSGKSYSISIYIKNFKEIFPSRKIYLFSDQSVDEQLDQYKVIRIKLDESLIDDPIKPEELSNSLCIFDDIDSIQDKRLKFTVENLRDSILRRGRHQNIYCISSAHNCTDYRSSRAILNESNIIFIYPKSGATNAIEYLLKKYVGLKNDQIEKIFSLPSRWVAVHKNYPLYVMYSTGVYLL